VPSPTARQVAVPPPPAHPAPAPAAKATGKAAEPAIPITAAARVKALTEGNMDLALQQGRLLARDIPPGAFTLRLEIACLGGTIQRLMELFKDREPDLFVLPIALKDGRMCYQVLYGRYPTRQTAERDLKRLPPVLLADRNQPKVFQFSDIPKMQ
jgi:septal ring-binding cell division protein DamX